MNPTTFISFSILLLCLTAGAEAGNFTCNAKSTATCQGIIGYVATNPTTYANITSLFQITPFSSLLGVNNLPLSTSRTKAVPANTTVRIPIQCLCTNGTGQSAHVPVYTVQAGDNLDAIARNKFELFTTYQDIAAVNNITDPSLIVPGQKLWIPLPCSCDPVGGKKVVHLAYRVAPGDNVSAIAQEFGTDQTTLLKLNGMSDPKTLQAEQILDVPLSVCNSSINTSSPDYDLTVANGTYSLTANGCVQCNCFSNSSMLSCNLVNQSKTCPATTCSGTTNLSLGGSHSSGCTVTTCAYNGYTNISSFNILTVPINQTTCPSGGGLGNLRLVGSVPRMLIVSLHVILILFCFI